MLCIYEARDVIIHLCTALANKKLDLGKFLPTDKEWRIISDMEEILDVCQLILMDECEC